MLSLTGVSRRFDPDKVIFDDLNISLRPGQALALSGANGAGKTTLLRMIATIIDPSSGRIAVGGCCTQKQAKEVRNLIGFAPASDHNFIPRMTGLDNLKFFISLQRRSKTECLKVVEDLAEKPWALKQALATPYYKCSNGMKQTLSIARALLHQPKILLLDEPERGLDPKSQQMIRQTLESLKNDGMTLVISSHNMSIFDGVYDQLLDLTEIEDGVKIG